MYKIIGADQKEYGPVNGDQVRKWINEGRANGLTMAQAEGATDWKPLSAFPEFADALAAKAPPPPAPGAPPIDAKVDPEALAREILSRDYTLDVFSCLSRGWERLQRD